LFSEIFSVLSKVETSSIRLEPEWITNIRVFITQDSFKFDANRTVFYYRQYREDLTKWTLLLEMNWCIGKKLSLSFMFMNKNSVNNHFWGGKVYSCSLLVGMYQHQNLPKTFGGFGFWVSFGFGEFGIWVVLILAFGFWSSHALLK
jgi:hypothetical protein